MVEWGYANDSDGGVAWVAVDKSVLDDAADGVEKLIGFEGTPDPATGFYCVRTTIVYRLPSKDIDDSVSATAYLLLLLSWNYKASSNVPRSTPVFSFFVVACRCTTRVDWSKIRMRMSVVVV